jgi:hypothetical protein
MYVHYDERRTHLLVIMAMVRSFLCLYNLHILQARWGREGEHAAKKRKEVY